MKKPWKDSGKEAQLFLKALQEKKETPLRAGLLAFRSIKDPRPFESVEVLSEKGDLAQAAANLFQAIRKLDKMHLDVLLAEPVPEKGIGLAIMDRLKKASGGKSLC